VGHNHIHGIYNLHAANQGGLQVQVDIIIVQTVHQSQLLMAVWWTD